MILIDIYTNIIGRLNYLMMVPTKTILNCVQLKIIPMDNTNKHK